MRARLLKAPGVANSFITHNETIKEVFQVPVYDYLPGLFCVSRKILHRIFRLSPLEAIFHTLNTHVYFRR